ncbi:MAG: DUF2490 domain-containing protein [Lentimicrobium sp.]|nr:DUF2490 domain-containing protein [Lentimicrobium sp.]
MGNKTFTTLLILLGICSGTFAQTAEYSQFSSEIQFARAISDKWSGEVDLLGTFSSTPTESRPLKTNVQRGVSIYGHYYYSSRWKFSPFLAYYYNKDVPEIGQYKSPEWRFALQGIYYFHKIGYILSTRMRAEFRYIRNEAGTFEDSYRYRQQIKYVLPINSQMLRKGVFYMLASEEIAIRSVAKTTGMTYFDRNLFSMGVGYLITDDFQVELAYTNEFVPRDEENQVYNVMGLTITFNNPIPNLKKTISGWSGEPDAIE